MRRCPNRCQYASEIQYLMNVHSKWKTAEWLEKMISQITIDSRSTMTYIQSTLSDHDKHMVRFDCNVTQFNDFVKTQIDALQASGETSKDIMVIHSRAIKPLSHTRTKSMTGARNTKCGQSTRQKTKGLIDRLKEILCMQGTLLRQCLWATTQAVIRACATRPNK